MQPTRPEQPSPPEALVQIQDLFGKAVSTPFLFEDNQFVGLAADKYPTQLLGRITAQQERNLTAADRVGTYNRQYWFRLFNVMQEEYPLTTALMGLTAFNRMVMAYLTSYPPHSPSLRDLSSSLQRFLSQDPEWGLPVVLEATRLEHAFIMAFDAAHFPGLDPAQGGEGLLDRTLLLQPHLFLIEAHWDLLPWRAIAKKSESPHELEVDLSEQHHYLTVYRHEGVVTTQVLGPLQFKLMTALQKGRSINEAVALTCEGLGPTELSFLESHIGSWFAQWSALQWFCSPVKE